MKSFQIKPAEVERKWYVIDGANKILGRIASKAAMAIMGKNKPIYTPNVDCGDFVIVLNVDKIKLSGKKLEQKLDFTHSGYPTGDKYTPYSILMKKNPERAMMLAVKGMLPKNKLRDRMIKRLKSYQGDKHPHAGEKLGSIKV
ncbi:MAG: 50S ribosomal protein L13 [Candidatus Firestonebacteria bacterium]|nr:50S ribosomal protein L13 [Candidatus Firestonebacteria bacterium]